MEKFINEISFLWGKLPAEVKVALFIATSQGISALIIELSKLEINSVWLGIALNIVLVFLRELKPRIERLKEDK